MLPWNTTNYNDNYLNVLQKEILPLWKNNKPINESSMLKLVQFPNTRTHATYHPNIVSKSQSKQLTTKTKGIASKIFNNVDDTEILDQMRKQVEFTSLAKGKTPLFLLDFYLVNHVHHIFRILISIYIAADGYS